MTKNESAQPQLPPRPERVMDEIGFYTLYQAHEVDAYMNVLEAENISLRSQIVQGDGSCDHCGRVPAVVLPTSLCDECADGVKRAEKAEAERDQALEVIREYREDHLEASIWSAKSRDCDCPTCIKADALLSRETKG